MHVLFDSVSIHFLICKMRVKCLVMGLLLGINEFLHVKPLQQCLAHTKRQDSIAFNSVVREAGGYALGDFRDILPIDHDENGVFWNHSVW